MNEQEKEKKGKEEEKEIAAPFLKGETVDLLPIDLGHASLYTKWFNLEEMRMYSRNEYPKTREEIKKKFESKDKGEKKSISLEIWHKKDQKSIGLGGLNHINWFNRSANIFIILDPEYQRKSIGTEVGQLLVDYGFLELNLQKIYSMIIEANISSWKTAEKIGFELEAKLEDEAYVDGKFYAEKNYAVFREEWLASKKNKNPSL